MFGPRIYKSSSHDFFDEVATLFINLASLNAATESFSNSSSTQIPNSPNHTLYLYGKVAIAAFPIHQLMHGLVRNQWPSELVLALGHASSTTNLIPNGIELQSNAIANMIVQSVGAAFLKFYERNAPTIKRRYPSGPKTWSEQWRLGWLLRNAIAHGDRWAINDPSFPETTWHSITISPQDSGKPWFCLTNYIGGGDVLLLMEELNRDLNPPHESA